MRLYIESVENGFIVKELAGVDDEAEPRTRVFSEIDTINPDICNVDHIVCMLYSVLELLGVQGDKGSEHNVVINCESGKWVDDPPLCPNRHDFYDRMYPELKEET